MKEIEFQLFGGHLTLFLVGIRHEAPKWGSRELIFLRK